MRIRLVALAATLSIVGLAAASFAGATAPSGGSVSSGGAGSAGGGGGSHGGGGGGGGGHSGGGSYGGGHFGGGGYRGGGGFRGGTYGGGAYNGGAYRSGGYRGGGSAGGYASHANFMARGGYVSHGARGYHVVGYQSAGLAHVTAIPHGGQASRIPLALGPRMGSAATAVRMDPVARVTHAGIARMARVDRLVPHPGHPPRHPKRPHTRPQRSYGVPHFSQYRLMLPVFCDFGLRTPEPDERPLPPYGCLGPVKAKTAIRQP